MISEFEIPLFRAACGEAGAIPTRGRSPGFGGGDIVESELEATGERDRSLVDPFFLASALPRLRPTETDRERERLRDEARDTNTRELFNTRARAC